jgi:hypothetical protein
VNPWLRTALSDARCCEIVVVIAVSAIATIAIAYVVAVSQVATIGGCNGGD